MIVLVVGDRARDHIIALRLHQSEGVIVLYITPGNAGTGMLGINLGIPVSDIDAIVSKAIELGVTHVVIGPEEPLRDGLSDKLQAQGIKVFGPTSAAAEVEWSKEYGSIVNELIGLPQPQSWRFDDIEDAQAFVLANPELELVIKADKLAGGKAVTVCKDSDEAFDTVTAYMTGQAFGEAGKRIVIQERVRGVEISALAFCSHKDGQVQLSQIFFACDTKQRDGKEGGKNTGGIACFGQPTVGPLFAERVRAIMYGLLQYLYSIGRPFVGILYAGLMVTEDGDIKILEWNARFGDPEAEVMLTLLKGDFGEIVQACIDGRLDEVPVEYDTDYVAVCLVLLDKHYPDDPLHNNSVITGLNEGDTDNVFVLQFQTQERDGKTVTAGSGRRLAVVAKAATFEEALALAQKRAEEIDYANKDYLEDLQERVLPDWARL